MPNQDQKTHHDCKDSIQPHSISSWCSDRGSRMCHKCLFSFFEQHFFVNRGSGWSGFYTCPPHNVLNKRFLDTIFNYLSSLVTSALPHAVLYSFFFPFLAWPEDRRQLNRHMQCSILPNCKALWLLGTFIHTWTFSRSYSKMTSS